MSFPRFNRYWVLVVAWMTFIFAASTGLGTPQNTSRFLGPLLRWFYPGISNESVKFLQFCIRKTAHAFEYGVLALLVWLALRKGSTFDVGRWNRRHARFAVLFCALYAGTDELHQLFVESRQGSPWDVLLDTSGAAIAMLLLWRLGKWRSWW